MLLIADCDDGGFPLDPIRLMKGCFLVSQIGRDEWRGLFDFEPYDYGPFDTSVYRTRDELLANGFLESREAGRYGQYVVTDLGKDHLHELVQRGEATAADAEWFRSIGRWVTSKSFSELLREIYDHFPNYATRSIAQI